MFAKELRKDFFRNGHVGCLYQLGNDDYIKVTVSVIIRPGSYIWKTRVDFLCVLIRFVLKLIKMSL